MNFIIGLLASPIGALLAWIYGMVNNYGLSIIILTFVVRIAMLPLYAKQIKYQAKLAELEPKRKEIQRAYANNRDMLNQKMGELFRDEGVSPTSGCLPLLVQMPIVMGLFALLRNPLVYMTAPEMIAGVHESFIWIKDLCQPDSWILPLAAGITTFFSSASNSSAAGSENAGMMKGMQYFFPVMIFLMGRSFPSGVALYWAFGNLFTIGQTLYFRKQNEKEKLRKEVLAKAKENRKQAKEQN